MKKSDIKDKTKQFGHNVPHSQKRTKRVFNPNFQKKTFVVDGKKITMRLSADAIRTLKKKGVIGDSFEEKK